MKKFVTSAAVAAFVLAAVPAWAGPIITSASLNGPTGTVWNTTVDSYYTLFVSRPVTMMFNPNDNFAGAPVTNPVAGSYDFQIMGDGFPTARRSNTPSDPFYTLTLTLTEGASTGTLSGFFTEATGDFTPTSPALLFSSGRYALTDFTWTRSLSNLVGAYSATDSTPIGPGSRADYQGAFTLNSSAVPEPATWALMILGFAGIGGALRARRGRKPVAALA